MFYYYLKLFLTFSVFSHVAVSQCDYSSNGYKLSLDSIMGQTFFWNSIPIYAWTPCSNSLTCGTSDTAMATAVYPGSSNCNKLAVWDASAPASYDLSTSMWTIEFENGAICNNASSILLLCLTCFPDINSTVFTSVVNPYGDCRFKYYLGGPTFCPTGDGDGVVNYHSNLPVKC